MGLIMVSVVSSLAKNVNAQTVGRPIGVSFAFLLAAIVAMKCLPFPLQHDLFAKWRPYFERFSFMITGLALLGLVAAAGYAGTSILFVGYLTGISATYLFENSIQNPALECYEK